MGSCSTKKWERKSPYISKYKEEEVLFWQGPIKSGKHPKKQKQNQGTLRKEFLDRKPQNFGKTNENVILGIGDNRKKVQDKKAYPFCSIGYLSMDFGPSTAFGTACIISDNVILTCAHNVYNRQNRQSANEIFFTPALHGNSGTPIKALKYYYPPEYALSKQEESERWDFAVIKLETSDLSEYYGMLGVNTYWQNSKEQVYIYGYPADLNAQFDSTLSLKYQYGEAKRILDIEKEMINYDIATGRGQSGAPILRKESNGNFQIVGIHTQGTCEKFNCGVKVTERVRKRINQWLVRIAGTLDLSLSSLNDNDLKVLARDPWDTVVKLDLCLNNIGSRGVSYLILNPWKALNSLNLNHNAIGPQGVKFLVKHPWLSLSSLTISHNNIGNQGVKFLIVHVWAILTNLDLGSNSITNQGVSHLTKHPWPSLTLLSLGNNSIDSMALQFIEQHPWTSLVELKLEQNKIREKDGVRLAKKLSKKKVSF